MKKIPELLGDRKAYSVKATMTISEAVEYMCTRKIGAVAVFEHNKVVGVFSERNLMRHVVNASQDVSSTSVSEAMNHPVVYLLMDENYTAAGSLMMGRNFCHLVVVDENEQLQGFVSLRDLIEEDLNESRELVHKLNDGYYKDNFQPSRH